MFNRGHWKNFILENDLPAIGARRQGQPSYDLAGADETTFSTDWLTDRTIDFVADPDATKPFFAVVSYPDPHGPNTVRAPYDHRFDNLRFKAPRTYETGIPAPKWLGGTKKHPVFRGEDMSRYFGMVQCIDDNLGRLFQRLDESGRLDDTLIVMTSDHGDLCYEHDRQNKGNPYEGSARVPMILRYPGKIAAAQVYHHPMGTVDVTPTVMGLLQLPADPADQGRDLSAVLRNVSQQSADQEKPPTIFLRNAGQKPNWVAAVDHRYKLILSVSDDPWLFDAEQDPDELLNFYRRPGTEGVAERLAQALRAYSIDHQDPFFADERIARSLARVLGEPVRNDQSYRSEWKGSRRWIGPDWWANPLTDWSLRGAAAIGTAAADRSLCLLPAEIGGKGEEFELEVQVQARGDLNVPKAAAGFRIGRQGGIQDYRHALVHATSSIDAVIRASGKLELADQVSSQSLPLGSGTVTLKLLGKRDGDEMRLVFSASSAGKTIEVETSVDPADLVGGVSLLADGPTLRGGNTDPPLRFAFQEFHVSGEAVRTYDDRSFGPILWSQYTLDKHRLRLQAQFAPLGPQQNHVAELWVKDKDDGAWNKLAASPIDKLSRTAAFTIDDWSTDRATPYEVRFSWRGDSYVWPGTVRQPPAAEAPLTLACFSCDNGYLFPIPAMVQQVKRQNPDLLFFAGDQIYESYGGFGIVRDDVPLAMVDYLRKYYQFGWTWRDLMRDRPTVILPDDHDVFQGNIWGHGGRRLPDSEKANDWALGGYRMPGEWVSAVERTQVGHLPDPAVDATLPIGIKPYFTSMTYGGVGFAILEDRKFKTGPLSLPEGKRADGDGAQLLGEDQEQFLEGWGQDWNDHTMKCALSQTIFCDAATHTGPKLNFGRFYYDSGAWPKAARNRAVKLLGDCNALSIHGDQHLGVLLRHGVDDFDDAGYAFMVPGTANGFPRAWWPGVRKGELPAPDQDFTGKFRDDAGHPIHVLAVGNPDPESNLLPKTVDPMEIGRRKGSGYGMVVFDKQQRTATIALYRLGNDDAMFPGFPQTIALGGAP